ncbi:MAG: amidohydrolase family protein [Burkholderiales bacterium]|nr:amidohydrolase family protein [Burkholderiales bacterium]
MSSAVIDVHTHMLSDAWVAALREHGAPRYSLKTVRGGLEAIHLDGAPFMTPVPGMFDYDARIRMMDNAGIDVSIISLTCPNVFWGGEEVSSRTAAMMNDTFRAAQGRYAGRIQWFATLPWQYPARAVAELARARQMGAVGVMVLANIDGAHLTDEKFAPVWQAIDDAALPVLVHPSAPPGVAAMDMVRFQLTASIGFTFDTSLAVARMIYDGFLDRYPNLKIIASHGGGALPFLIGRMDQCFHNIPACREKIELEPSDYLRRIYVDSVVFRQDVLEMCVRQVGSMNVLYGSDYPHTIGDVYNTLAQVDALPDGVRDRVRGGNAQRIFRL